MQSQNMYSRDEEQSSEQNHGIEAHFHHYGRASDKIQLPQKFTVLRRMSLMLVILSLLDSIISGIFINLNVSDIGFFTGILNTLVVNVLFYCLVKTFINKLRPEKAAIFLLTMFVSVLLLIILPPKYSVELGLMPALAGLWTGAILLNSITYMKVRNIHMPRHVNSPVH